MMTGSQYEESLRKLNLEVYLFGERVGNVVDHPLIRPSMNAVALTYNLAHCPEYAELMTATSHLTGRQINRFTHIHQSTDDLVKKSKMGRLLGSLTGCCFQRCVGMDALNALSITTANVDARCGTEYNRRFLKLPGVRPGEGPHLRRRDDRPEGGPVASRRTPRRTPTPTSTSWSKGRTASSSAGRRPTRPAP